MITSLTGSSINDLFYQILHEIWKWPEEQRRDNKLTVDSPGPVIIDMLDPRKRVLTVPKRNNSIIAACAETLWVLAGHNDLAFLSYYLPRAKDYSDDEGRTWRAAYGPRLRGRCDDRGPDGNDGYFVDQLALVIKDLSERPTSRRAVISLLDWQSLGNDFDNFTSKDFPCTQSLSFMPRNGRLDLLVTIRSNDILFGWSGINIFEFTFLHQLVAHLVGIPLGCFYLISNSLHYYKKEFDTRFRNMASATAYDVYDHTVMPNPTNSLFGYGLDGLHIIDSQLKMIFDVEDYLRTRNSGDLDIGDLTFAGLPLFISDLVFVTLLGSFVLNCDKHPWSDYEDGLASRLFDRVRDNALRVSLSEFLWRYYHRNEGGVLPCQLDDAMRSTWISCDAGTRMFISGGL